MEKLIEKFEKRLNRVKAMHTLGDKVGSVKYMKSMEYIKYAEGELEAVKLGGMEALKEYYNKSK